MGQILSQSTSRHPDEAGSKERNLSSQSIKNLQNCRAPSRNIKEVSALREIIEAIKIPAVADEAVG